MQEKEWITNVINMQMIIWVEGKKTFASYPNPENRVHIKKKK